MGIAEMPPTVRPPSSSENNNNNNNVDAAAACTAVALVAPLCRQLLDGCDESERVPLRSTAVQMTALSSLVSAHRQLFLFRRWLVVAKHKGVTSWKAKERVRLDRLWMAATDASHALLLGWPPAHNVLVHFRDASERDDWWTTLDAAIAAHRPTGSGTDVSLHVVVAGRRQMIRRRVTNGTTSAAIVLETAAALGLPANGSYQLRFHVSAASNSGAGSIGSGSLQPALVHSRPLQGPENVYAVLMAELDRLAEQGALAQPLAESHRRSLHTCPLLCACLILVETGGSSSPPSTERALHAVNSIRKRVLHRAESAAAAAVAAAAPAFSSASAVFGRPLSSLAAPPQPILSIIDHLRAQSADTEGLFRKSPKQSAVRELRLKLDAGVVPDFHSYSPHVLASLLKDYLRSIPGQLLVSANWLQWRQLVVAELDDQRRLAAIRGLLSLLPQSHAILLANLLRLLAAVASAPDSKMSADSLAVCLAPSFLQPPPSLPDELEDGCGGGGGGGTEGAAAAEAASGRRAAAVVRLLVEKTIQQQPQGLVPGVFRGNLFQPASSPSPSPVPPPLLHNNNNNNNNISSDGDEDNVSLSSDDDDDDQRLATACSSSSKCDDEQPKLDQNANQPEMMSRSNSNMDTARKESNARPVKISPKSENGDERIQKMDDMTTEPPNRPPPAIPSPSALPRFVASSAAGDNGGVRCDRPPTCSPPPPQRPLRREKISAVEELLHNEAADFRTSAERELNALDQLMFATLRSAAVDPHSLPARQQQQQQQSSDRTRSATEEVPDDPPPPPSTSLPSPAPSTRPLPPFPSSSLPPSSPFAFTRNAFRSSAAPKLAPVPKPSPHFFTKAYAAGDSSTLEKMVTSGASEPVHPINRSSSFMTSSSSSTRPPKLLCAELSKPVVAAAPSRRPSSRARPPSRVVRGSSCVPTHSSCDSGSTPCAARRRSSAAATTAAVGHIEINWSVAALKQRFQRASTEPPLICTEYAAYSKGNGHDSSG